jgi:hypothetical protein
LSSFKVKKEKERIEIQGYQNLHILQAKIRKMEQRNLLECERHGSEFSDGDFPPRNACFASNGCWRKGMEWAEKGRRERSKGRTQGEKQRE